MLQRVIGKEGAGRENSRKLRIEQVTLGKIFSRGWVRLLICCLLAALAVPVIETSMDAFPTWPQMWMGYWSGLSYSLAIGGILNLLAPVTWKLTPQLPPLRRWGVRTFVILLGTAAGCLLAGLVRLGLQGRSYPYWLAFRESFGLSVVLSLLITIVLSTYEQFKSQLHTNQLQLKEKEVEREKAMKLATGAGGEDAGADGRVTAIFFGFGARAAGAAGARDEDRARLSGD
jgi:hypothetical protein